MSDDARTMQREFEGEKFEVALKDLIRPESTLGRFPEFDPGVSEQDGIRAERDVAVPMRDGTTIYTDIYRPVGETDVPAIIAWSPYGKRYSYTGLMAPGVAPGTYSPGTKFEGPDPDYWCRRGYAVVNPDPRGIGNSEGVHELWTRQEARDEYDLIEWIAAQEWCSGRIGMSGNSYVASSQWYAAAQRPPSLTCIAPWEGATDPYRHIFMIGGVPALGQATWESSMSGSGLGEGMQANMALHPLRDAYWREKLPDFEKIDIPAYVCGGWSHHYHLKGSLDAFSRISSSEKWLRLHREFEWPDYYTPENLEDLQRFFDRYLKGLHNGWEMTPRVRVDVMDRGDRDHAVRRPETAFPLPDTEYRKLRLDASGMTLRDEPVPAEITVSYDARTGQAAFDLTFDRDTELTGYCSLHVWFEARGASDADVFVTIQKLDERGGVVPTLAIGHPYPGPLGLMRVSHRALDDRLSTEVIPVHRHDAQQPLRPGEIVPVDISLWPTSRIWHAGERLRVVVSGHYLGFADALVDEDWDVRNEGEHVLHLGGRFDSYFVVPQTPQRRAVIPGDSITAFKMVQFKEIVKSEEPVE